jgi:prolyl-tRNA synthetase
VITDVARREIKSYRQLPRNFYQIQMKFRDEIRPRFGVMRAREFLMKDAYSFHADTASLQAEYRNMYDTYTRIFTRLGLRFRAVAADTGAIGGTGSHEFHVLADSGEDSIAFCPDSDYAANVEMAEALAPRTPRAAPGEAMQRVATPGKKTCQEVAEFLGLPVEKTVKSVMLWANDALYMLLVRGDHSLNEIKTSKIPFLTSFRFATDVEIEKGLHARPGYIGPVGASNTITVIADRTVAAMSDFVCGANKDGFHLTGANFGRDLPEPAYVHDIRDVIAGDPSPDGRGTLDICRGIEVGHVFQLGAKYSAAMGASFLDEAGQNRVMEMGCYGIGVSRIVAAAIEQNYDDRGIFFPEPMAPFHVAVAPVGYGKSAEVQAAALTLHDDLEAAGFEVLLDDRDERPGVMFADLELIGIPHRLVVSERTLKQGEAEYRGRRDTESRNIALRDAVEYLKSKAC